MPKVIRRIAIDVRPEDVIIFMWDGPGDQSPRRRQLVGMIPADIVGLLKTTCPPGDDVVVGVTICGKIEVIDGVATVGACANPQWAFSSPEREFKDAGYLIFQMIDEVTGLTRANTEQSYYHNRNNATGASLAARDLANAHSDTGDGDASES